MKPFLVKMQQSRPMHEASDCGLLEILAMIHLCNHGNEPVHWTRDDQLAIGIYFSKRLPGIGLGRLRQMYFHLYISILGNF